MNLARLLSISLFVLAGLALVVLEVLARREGSRIPTLGAAAAFVMRHPAVRVAVYAVWWWLGWHLFAR
jgi:hypothetical protein